jgi:hypothetical protein
LIFDGHFWKNIIQAWGATVARFCKNATFWAKISTPAGD